jgi:hypothetical protein
MTIKKTFKFYSREEAQAFKLGIEYLQNPKITVVWIHEINYRGHGYTIYEVTFYDERG